MTADAALEALRNMYSVDATRHNRPDHLRSVQRRAFEQFLAAGFPTTRQESWRYSSLTPLEERCARYISGAAPPQPLPARQVAALRAPPPGSHLCLVDGRFEPGCSRLPPADAGIRVRTLSRDAADPDLQALLEPGQDRVAATPFLDLNTALLSDGLVIDVANGAEIPDTLTLDLIGSGTAVHAQSRINVRLGAGARLALLVRQTSEGQALGNTVIAVTLESGAELALVRQQTEAEEAFQTSLLQMSLGPGSTARCFGLDLGGALVRNDLFVDMAGPGASFGYTGICLARQRQHIDNHVRIDHHARQGRSDTSYRCILADEARGVFNGQIVVHPRADGTDAQLTNRNLLLAATAEIDTKPELEIYTDDVKCSHGATTGQLDPSAIFYLRSRGVADAEARRMLVQAFLVESLSDCPIDSVRTLLDEVLSKPLADLYREAPA